MTFYSGLALHRTLGSPFLASPAVPLNSIPGLQQTLIVVAVANLEQSALSSMKTSCLALHNVVVAAHDNGLQYCRKDQQDIRQDADCGTDAAVVDH